MLQLRYFVALTVLAACARDSKPAPTAAVRADDTGAVPDLNIDVQPVGALAEPDIAWQNAPTLIDPGARDPREVRDAIAILAPTRGSKASGIVRFRDSGAGLDVFATVDGLPKGAHAYHVHVYGDCSADDGSSAGPHFNFSGSSFDKRVERITGNLGEVRADGAPTSTDRSRHPAASLSGMFSIIGRAVVVHELPNDPTVTPDGGAGARLACGVIGIANGEAPSVRTARP